MPDSPPTPRQILGMSADIQRTARHPRGKADKLALSEYLRGVPLPLRTARAVHPVELDASRQALQDDSRETREILESGPVTLTGVVVVARTTTLDTAKVPDRTGPPVCRAVPVNGPDRATVVTTVTRYPVGAPGELDSARRLASVASDSRREARLAYEAWMDGGRQSPAAWVRGAPSGWSGMTRRDAPEHGAPLDSAAYAGGAVTRDQKPETLQGLAANGAPSVGWAVRRGRLQPTGPTARERRAARRAAKSR